MNTLSSLFLFSITDKHSQTTKRQEAGEYLNYKHPCAHFSLHSTLELFKLGSTCLLETSPLCTWFALSCAAYPIAERDRLQRERKRDSFEGEHCNHSAIHWNGKGLGEGKREKHSKEIKERKGIKSKKYREVEVTNKQERRR